MSLAASMPDCFAAYSKRWNWSTFRPTAAAASCNPEPHSKARMNLSVTIPTMRSKATKPPIIFPRFEPNLVSAPSTALILPVALSFATMSNCRERAILLGSLYS